MIIVKIVVSIAVIFIAIIILTEIIGRLQNRYLIKEVKKLEKEGKFKEACCTKVDVLLLDKNW